jgi:hypothetical protein
LPDSWSASSVHGSPQRRRFVRDGEVPVVVVRRHDGADSVTSSASKIVVTEAALAAEKVEREKAEKALAEAQTTIHDLQTRLGHAILERDEAREIAQRAEEDCRAAVVQASRPSPTSTLGGKLVAYAVAALLRKGDTGEREQIAAELREELLRSVARTI